MQEFDKAIFELRIAANLDPYSPIILADIAVNFYHLNEYESAIEEAQKALEINPDFMPALWILGETYLATGMNDEAVAVIEKAVKINSGADQHLAYAYATIGKISEAREILENMSPERIWNFWLYSGILCELGDIDQALERFQNL